MKKLLYLICLLFPSIMSAQTNNMLDRFTDYSQTVGNVVYLFDIQNIILTNGKFVSINNKGKLKSLSTKDIFGGADIVQIKCEEIVNVKDKQYLKCEYNNESYYLYINPKKDSYIKKMRNISYWEKYLLDNINSHAYLYDPTANEKKLTEQYTKCEWTGVYVPQNTIEDDVVFYVKFGGSTKRSLIPYSYFIHPKDGKQFKSQEDYNHDLIEQARLDSLQEVEYKIKDMTPIPAICIKEYSYGDEDYQVVNEGDTAFAYYADDKVLSVMTGYCDITVNHDYFNFVDKRQLTYLKMRGKHNIDARKETADNYSSDCFSRSLQQTTERLEEAIAQYKAREKELQTKQLFLDDIDYVYGNYGDFGMSFSIYNCFKKTIKYIEFTCTPYNAVGDIQSDWVGKRVSRSKGIGPLEPGETATWSWDDLFYDKNDIIDKVRLTGIKFIFTNGSVLNFTGYQNILKHHL